MIENLTKELSFKELTGMSSETYLFNMLMDKIGNPTRAVEGTSIHNTMIAALEFEYGREKS